MAFRSYAREREILRAIDDFAEEHKYPPTIREIGEMVGLSSSSTVASYLRRLEDDKMLTSKEMQPRTLVVTEAGRDFYE
ncbi:LexA family protein [Lacticaseibacillus porcinae]|jgi:repressor LexA|uniref:LexA family protein n=1 Tax=Lacticaseibacillus porcinae TaxID=1123687 RepID=UPI000F793947|nr:transcriptional regulator [Lacticaseibacillus porcinae]